MIPQEAVLIDGTAAENLDPFGNYSTQDLRAVLEKVGLAADLVDQQVYCVCP